MKMLRILNIFTLGMTLTINALANILPINGQNTGQISDSYPVLFTPAGYVFAIWSLIYLALIGFAGYQVLRSQAANVRLGKIGPWFIVSNIFNSLWIVAWHYNQVLISWLLMLGLLISLIVIYQRLEIGLHKVSPVEGLFTNFPFSLYLGWISVATIANTTVLLFDAQWNGFSLDPQIWTVIVLAVGAILGIIMVARRNEIVFPLVLIWAFAGIQYKPGVPQLVGTAAGAAALIILLFLVFQLLRSRQRMLLEARKNRPNL